MNNSNQFLLLLLLLISGITNAQLGIGTISPDKSSVLDLTSKTKGFLIPRMTSQEQSVLENPAVGLMIFNITNSQIETNIGDGLGGILWSNATTTGTTAPVGTNTTQLATTAFVLANTVGYASVNEIEPTSTSSLTDVLAKGMLLTPPAGVYSVSFNSQYNNDLITNTATVASIGTAQGALDLQTAYDQLTALPVTNTTHIPAFGSGETLFPGVYFISGAASIAGTLNLDANGDSNALFVFKSGGAMAAGAATNVVLLNGAEARNVFWVSEGSPSIGASSTMKGTMIGHNGAASMSASGSLEGRILTILGAITFGPGTAIIPTGVSPINLGVIASFVLFTSSGAVSNSVTSASSFKGNIGTNLGVISGFELSTVEGKFYTSATPVIPSTSTSIVINDLKTPVTFSIYQNGVIIPSATKTLISNASAANISLQAIATVNTGQTIEVRWKTASSKLSMGSRTLTAIKVQ
jgi:hypothetical protein